MTPRNYSEDELVERPTLDLLEALGYEIADGYVEASGPEGLGRDDQSQVVLRHRLGPKLAELNPELPAAAIEAAVEELVRDRSVLERTRANREVHRLLRDGVTVTFADEESGRSTETVRVIDWIAPAENEFLAVRQLWVVGPLHTRRCDIVCFVNGIPLVLLELKASHKTVEQAYRKNLRDYRDTIPQLFTPNAFVILSNGSETKVGAHLRRVGALRRVEADRRRGRARDRLPRHRDPRHSASRRGCSTWSRTSSPIWSGPAACSRSLPRTTRCSASTRAMRALADPASTRRAARRLLAHPGLGQEPLDADVRPEGAAPRARQLDLRDRHRPRRARRPDRTRTFKDCRRSDEGQPCRPTPPRICGGCCGEDHRYVFTLIHKFRPPEARADAGAARTAATSSSSPTRRIAANTTSSQPTCAARCRTPPSSASPARR